MTKTVPGDCRNREMSSRLVLSSEAEGQSVAQPRALMPDRPFREQNCEGRALIQDPARPRLTSSCGQDLYVSFRRPSEKAAALRLFIGTRRQNFPAPYDVLTNHEQPQRTAGRMPRAIPRGVDVKGMDL
jgi:hypothetical protein